jgi:hypothetical protein
MRHISSVLALTAALLPMHMTAQAAHRTTTVPTTKILAIGSLTAPITSEEMKRSCQTRCGIPYLLIDRRDIPLIIEQPEDNLDKLRVYDMLVANRSGVCSGWNIVSQLRVPLPPFACLGVMPVSQYRQENQCRDTSDDNTQLVYKCATNLGFIYCFFSPEQRPECPILSM